MLIDLQLNSKTFVDIFLQRLRRTPFCASIPFTIDGKDALMERISFLGGELGRDGGDSIVRVQVEFRYVMVDTLAGSLSGQPLQITTQGIWLHFALSMDAKGGIPNLCASYRNSVPASAAVDAALKGQGACTGVDVGRLGSLLGDAERGRVVRAGLGVHEHLDTLAMWLDMGEPSNPDWNSLGQGTFAKRIDPEHDGWGIFTSADLLLAVATAQLSAALPNVPKFDVLKGPSARWVARTPLSFITGTAIAIGLTGRKHDACDCLIANSKVDLDLTVSLRFSVPEPGTLMLHSRLNYSIDDWSDPGAWCCAIDAIWNGTVKPGVLKVSAALAGFLSSVIAKPIDGAAKSSGDPAAGTKDCDGGVNAEGDGTCILDLGLDRVGFGKLVVRSCESLADGLQLRGTAEIDMPNPPQLTFTASSFRWVTELDCNAVSYGPTLQLASVTVANSAPYPQAVWAYCGIYPMSSDPDNIYEPTWSYYGNKLTIKVHSGYAGRIEPYGIDLILVTSAGIFPFRCTPVPRAPILSEEQRLRNAAYAVTECKRQFDLSGLGGYNVMWGPRPPDTLIDVPGAVRYLWDVLISGLEPGESVRLVDPAGETLMQALEVDGVAHLSALTVAGPTGEELSVVRSGDRGEWDSGRQIVVSQRLLLRQSTVHFSSPVHAIETGWAGGSKTLAAVNDEGFHAYDLTDLSSPTLSRQTLVTGLESLKASGPDFLAWGPAGRYRIPAQGDRPAVNLHTEQGGNPTTGRKDDTTRPDPRDTVAGPPWEADNLRSGDLFIALAEDRSSAAIYAVAAQERVFAGLPRRG